MIRPALAVMTSMSNCSTNLKGARYAVHQLENQQKVVVNVITTMQLQRKLDLLSLHSSIHVQPWLPERLGLRTNGVSRLTKHLTQNELQVFLVKCSLGCAVNLPSKLGLFTLAKTDTHHPFPRWCWFQYKCESIQNTPQVTESTSGATIDTVNVLLHN